MAPFRYRGASRPSREVSAPLGPKHGACVFLVGDGGVDDRGDESPWIASIASVICAGQPSATLLVNGGEIAYEDARHGLGAGRPLVVVAGTGRTADAIAGVVEGTSAAPRAVDLARSELVHAVDLQDGEGAARTLRVLLAPA